MDSINIVKHNEICSKGGAAEEEHVVEDETEAENSNDVRERLTEDLGHQNMESINIVKPSEICSKGGSAEEEHVVENETKAESSDDTYERLTEDLWHQSMESVNIVKPDKICNKEGAAKEEHVIDIKAPRLMELSNPKEAKAGLRIQFMHDEGEGTVYWLEGTIEQ